MGNELPLFPPPPLLFNPLYSNIITPLILYLLFTPISLYPKGIFPPIPPEEGEAKHKVAMRETEKQPNEVVSPDNDNAEEKPGDKQQMELDIDKGADRESQEAA